MLTGTAVQTVGAAADPGCTPDPAGPGMAKVCLNESQEGVTAASFDGQSCDQVANRDASLDYFIFVLPASGDSGRTFTSPPNPTVWFDTGTTSGVIASNAKFFYASAPQGATLLEASAEADNGSGTPVGGEAQTFNLTHTCPATVTSTVSATTTSSTGTETTTTGTTTGTTTTHTTTTGTTTTGTTTHTTTTGTTTTGTTTSTTVTGSVSGSSTTSLSTTSSSTATGGVSGISTTTPGGGVGGITTPSTGAGMALLSGLLLLGGGLTAIGVSRRRRHSG